MIHEISHGRYGKGIRVTTPTRDETEFEVMEIQAEDPRATFGPIVLSVTGQYTAVGISMTDDI